MNSLKNYSVSIVVPTFKRLDMLKKALHSYKYLDTQPLEVIIPYRSDIDLETTIFLHENINNNPIWKLLPLNKNGQVFAMNEALNIYRGNIIVFFDDDFIPEKNWLSKVLEIFSSDQKIAGVGGRDIVYLENEKFIDIDKNIKYVGERNNVFGYFIGNHHIYGRGAKSVDVLKGCNMAFLRSAIGTLKFDERLKGKGAQIGNDSCFCLNIKNYNWDLIYDSNIVGRHYPAARTDIDRNCWSEERCYENSFNNTAIYMMYQSDIIKFKYFIYLFFVGFRYCPGLYFIVHSFLKRPKSILGQLKGGWKGYFDGLRMAKEFEKKPPGRPNKPSV